MIRAVLGTAIAVSITSSAFAETRSPEDVYADLWARCVAHVLDKADLRVDGLEALDAETSRKATKSDQIVYRAPPLKQTLLKPPFPHYGYYLHKTGDRGCRVYGAPIDVGQFQGHIWKDAIRERQFQYDGVEESAKPTRVTHRYSLDRESERKIVIESVTYNVFKRTGWAVIKETTP